MASTIQAEQLEELECLQVIYADSPHETLDLDAPLDSSLDSLSVKFTSTPVLLRFNLPTGYPKESPTDLRVDSLGIGMSRLQLFEMQLRLGSIIEARQGESLLFDLTDEVCAFAAGLRGDICDTMEEEDDEGDEEEYCLEEPLDNRLDHVTAMKYMGTKSVPGIMEELGPSIKLLHAEVVLRRDLLERFKRQRDVLRQRRMPRLRDRRARDAAADELSKVEVVFHGTLRRHVGSIVQSGFVVPGTKTKEGETVSVRCGSTWGMGIYASPDPSYSLSYTDNTTTGERKIPGQKLIVCVALMGRRRQCQGSDRRNVNEMEDFDSFISPSGLEYVFFNPAQLLPLYVLHITNAAGSAWADNLPQHMLSQRLRIALRHPLDGTSLTEKKDRQRLLTAHARKHLPHGFGPAGLNFVVEDIAGVDDDEELWGEFQNSLDEFQASRK